MRDVYHQGEKNFLGLALARAGNSNQNHIYFDKKHLQYEYEEHLKNLQARINSSESVIKQLNKAVIENKSNAKNERQAGAELGQAHVKLE